VPATVTPDPFTMVLFDGAEIRSIAEELASAIGLPSELAITIAVDETTPLGRAELQSADPVVLAVESGALEDPKAPRRLNRVGATDVIGRLLYEARDRLDPEFGDPPASSDLALPLASAWEVHCVGRLGRLGRPVQRQRRLYQFRNRHGFTDAADDAFDQLWTRDGLTWDAIVGLSEGARAALPA